MNLCFRRLARNTCVPLCVLLILVLDTICIQATVLAESSAGLLTSTLFTFQDHACDNEKLRMRCPHRTSIRVQRAVYGRQAPSSRMCAFAGPGWSTALASSSSTVPVPPPNLTEDTECHSPRSLQVVMDHCQDQKECRVLASAKTFAPDPCPGTSKYLQVAYQCRPNEFRSRVACENEELVLRCSRSERLAVYSAMFGRSQRGEHRNECPGQSAYDAECHEECALQTVMRACHGKRRCNLLATEQVFGNPCHEETSKYLSVVYTCVPRRILKANPDQFFAAFCNEGSTSVVPSLATEASTVVFSTTVNYSVTTYPGGIGDPSTTIEPEISASGEKINGFITDWIATWRFIAANQEKFILYTVMSLLIGLVLLLLVIIFVLVVQRHKAEKQAKLDISEPIANSTAAAESPALPPPETSLLLEDSSESNIEMLSFHQSNSLRRPPLSHAHHNSLDHNGQYPRGGSPFYNNTFRSDTAHRNYFYT